MMTFQEFFAEVLKRCPDRYCTADVKAGRHGSGAISIVWQAYDGAEGVGHTRDHGSPELALAELDELQRRGRASTLDDVQSISDSIGEVGCVA